MFLGDVLGESPNEEANRLFEEMGLVGVDEEGAIAFKRKLGAHLRRRKWGRSDFCREDAPAPSLPDT